MYEKVLFFVIGFIFSNDFSFYNIDGLFNRVKFDEKIFLDICLKNMKKFCMYFIYLVGYGLLF